MSKTFQKKVEDFTCKNCGVEVSGTGYTNHCPNCLWSRHVDIKPGDRENSCKGMMRPIGVELKCGEYSIIHKCEKCGTEKKNKVSEEDSFEEILKISKK